MKKIPAAIVGPGNIGTDLMYKLLRSELVEPRYMVGVDPDSAASKLAASSGSRRRTRASTGCSIAPELPGIVFEATSAYVHVRNAPRYRKAGILRSISPPRRVAPT
jgi:acetaldehyde dehydrogenase